MQLPENYYKEKERLEALKSYSILDTIPESDFDNITAIAAEICNTPISLISLVDDKRQWFKSHYGLTVNETPRELSFCAHAINHPDNIFTVNDARLDERFYDNPFVVHEPKVIFYTGIPLVGDDEYPLGTLCVIDVKPRILTDGQKNSLKALSNQVLNLLKLRKVNRLLEETQLKLKEKNDDLENFAYIAAHDIKGPLMNISTMCNLLLKNYGTKIDEEGREMVELITESSERLGDLVSGLLNYSLSEKYLTENKSHIPADEFKKEILSFFNRDINITFHIGCGEIFENKAALEQIFINLLTNSIKYNDKETTEIDITLEEIDDYYKITVKDNGPGIDPKYHEKVFEIFEVLTHKDKFGKTGNGIGLATVKKLVSRLGGTIRLESEIGKGATFIFTLKK